MFISYNHASEGDTRLPPQRLRFSFGMGHGEADPLTDRSPSRAKGFSSFTGFDRVPGKTEWLGDADLHTDFRPALILVFSFLLLHSPFRTQRRWYDRWGRGHRLEEELQTDKWVTVATFVVAYIKMRSHSSLAECRVTRLRAQTAAASPRQ